MKRLLPVLVLVAMLTTSTAFAQYWGGMGADNVFEGPRIHLGWVKAQDFDSTIVYGADYIWRNALATVNYFTDDGERVWTFEGSYLWRPQEDATIYAGGGLGFASQSNGNTDSGWLWNIVVGKEFQPENMVAGGAPYVEARYNFGSSGDTDDLSGIRLTVGYRF
ncbi:MAG: hypothetical protein GX100_05610 [candidate division WS1 bacterium]|jgi:hypothetical protein|nr:hypothetical protein [candidate division WS1 bacterium]